MLAPHKLSVTVALYINNDPGSGHTGLVSRDLLEYPVVFFHTSTRLYGKDNIRVPTYSRPSEFRFSFDLLTTTHVAALSLSWDFEDWSLLQFADVTPTFECLEWKKSYALGSPRLD
jgi:hypothetical protein